MRPQNVLTQVFYSIVAWVAFLGHLRPWDNPLKLFTPKNLQTVILIEKIFGQNIKILPHKSIHRVIFV
jgi:hypothetical protein